MLYGLIRVLIFAILALTLILLFKKHKNKKVFLISIVILIAFTVAIFNIPFENLFFSFDSPSEVLSYAGQGEIIGIAENTDSAMLMTKLNANQYSHFFVLKSGNKYKIADFNDGKKVAEEHYESITITIYNVKDTNDYYLNVWGTVSNETLLSDSCNTDFTVHYEKFSDRLTVTAIGALSSIDNYRIYIDGNEIAFDLHTS